jgi:hypothetical protein
MSGHSKKLKFLELPMLLNMTHFYEKGKQNRAVPQDL